MAVGDKLNDVLEPSNTRRAATEWKTDKKTWPNGRTTARRMWSQPRHSFELEFDGINLTEYQALQGHFNEHSGGYATFPFTDPHSGLTYTVRYDDDELERRMVRNVRGLYRVRVKLEESKA